MNQRTKVKPAATDRQAAAENRSVVDLRDHDATPSMGGGRERGNDPSASTRAAEMMTSRFAVDWAPPDR